MNTHELWQAALGELELKLSKAHFTTWFRNTFILEYESHQVTVGVPNTFTKAWLEKKYHKDILNAIQNITEHPIRGLDYRVETRACKKPARRPPLNKRPSPPHTKLWDLQPATKLHALKAPLTEATHLIRLLSENKMSLLMRLHRLLPRTRGEPTILSSFTEMLGWEKPTFCTQLETTSCKKMPTLAFYMPAVSSSPTTLSTLCAQGAQKNSKTATVLWTCFLLTTFSSSPEKRGHRRSFFTHSTPSTKKTSRSSFVPTAHPKPSPRLKRDFFPVWSGACWLMLGLLI